MDLTTAKHILGDFDDALRTMRDTVLMMASLTERLLASASESLSARSFEACERVIADDAEIDVLEKSVDEAGVAILVRFQPLANDLREVVAAMKVSTNLERVGDQAVGIARRARRLNESLALPETDRLVKMCRVAADIFRDSIRSYADRDEGLARGLKERGWLRTPVAFAIISISCSWRVISNALVTTPQTSPKTPSSPHRPKIFATPRHPREPECP